MKRLLLASILAVTGFTAFTSNQASAGRPAQHLCLINNEWVAVQSQKSLNIVQADGWKCYVQDANGNLSPDPLPSR